jgi:hypothetical protein
MSYKYPVGGTVIEDELIAICREIRKLVICAFLEVYI